MSEKRFKAEYTIPFTITDTVENKSYSSMRNVIKLLNDLAEENSALMKTLLYFIKDDDGEWINQVLEENEQLHKKNEELNMMIMNDILDKYKIAFEEVRKGTDIVKDLCSTCIYFSRSNFEISSMGSSHTTKCIKRGEINGILSECEDYKSV